MLDVLKMTLNAKSIEIKIPKQNAKSFVLKQKYEILYISTF